MNWKALTQLISLQDYLEEVLNSLTDSILDSPAGMSAQTQAKRKLSDEERIALQEEKDRMINQLSASIEAFSSLIPSCTQETLGLFTKVTSSDSFWTFLSSKEMDAPQIRRATWRTLSQILQHEQATSLIEDSIQTITRIAPIAAFRERDHQNQNTLWEPLITLFRKYPSIWRKPMTNADQEEESSESVLSSSSEQETDISAAPDMHTKIPYPIAAFFDALQVGFFGNTSSGYQAAPLLLHTIPETVFPRNTSNLESLFSSFWGAYAGAAIDASSTQAFVRCLVDFVRLSMSSQESASVAAEQLIRLWEYYLLAVALPSKSLSLSDPDTVQELEKGVVTLSSKYPDLFASFWSRFRDIAEKNVSNKAGGAALAEGLVGLARTPNEDLSKSTQTLLHRCTVVACTTEDREAPSAFLVQALHKNGKELLFSPDTRDVSRAPQWLFEARLIIFHRFSIVICSRLE